ncbi:MAG TPA: hypothetical protein VKW08_23310 [Xanthobacteraceae bacterium]|jgi:hypothetical protein|nr:hypothetical protein [Xanthobacteraceae bacterium]
MQALTAVALGIAAVVATAGAAAQQATESQSIAASAPKHHGPVGHRQPKMSDLPPALANKERSGMEPNQPTQGSDQGNTGESTSGQAQRNQDPIGDLKICRPC